MSLIAAGAWAGRMDELFGKQLPVLLKLDGIVVALSLG